MTTVVMASNALGLLLILPALAGMAGGRPFDALGFTGVLLALGAAVAGSYWLGALRSASVAPAAHLAQTNARLAAALAAAQSAGAAKREFMSNMSHELRTPMTAIIGYADLLTAPDLDGPERVEFIQNIRRSGRHLLTIINDILDISRVESGLLTIDLVPTSPFQIFEEILSLVRPQALAKSLHLTSLAELPVPSRILTDPARLRQVLLNVLGNAVKFTEQGSVMLRMDFVPGDSPAVRFHITDTGPGIEPDRLHSLLEPFTQADASPARRHGGLGVGLALASRLASLLGATLDARSEPGVGTTFTLSVPTGPLDGVPMRDQARASDAVRAAPAAETSPQEGVPLQGRRILFVEDGPDNRRLVCFHLKRAGAAVQTAENGRIGRDAALAAAGAGAPFDLVFMDMQMPEMDGYAATSLLRSEGYRSPIVALTAHAMAGDREKCLAAGCDDYITKPIDRDILIETARRWSGAIGSVGAAA